MSKFGVLLKIICSLVLGILIPFTPPSVHAWSGNIDSVKIASNGPSTSSQKEAAHFLKFNVEETARTEIPGTVLYTQFVKYTNKKDQQQIIQVLYSPLFQKNEYILGIISQKIKPDGTLTTSVTHNEGLSTFVNKITPTTLLSFEWLELQKAAIDFEQSEPAREFFRKTGTEFLTLILFSYRGIQNLNAVIDQYDQVIDEAFYIQNQLNVRDPVDRLMSQFISQQIDEALQAREDEIQRALLSITGLLTLDIVTAIPRAVLGPIVKYYGKLSLKIGATRFGRVTSALAARSVKLGRGTYAVGEICVAGAKKVCTQTGAQVAKLWNQTSKIGSKLVRPFSAAATRLGLIKLTSRVLEHIKLLKSLKIGWQFLSKNSKALMQHPSFKKFFDVSDALSMVALDEYTKRLYIANVVYSTIFSNMAQVLQRGTSIFTDPEQFKQFKFDFVHNFFFAIMVGRLTVRLDNKGSTMSVFREWRARQFTTHLYIIQDTYSQYKKLISEAGDEGLSSEDLDFLRKRMLANFMYNVTRGPLISSINASNNSAISRAIVNAERDGKLNTVVTKTAQEFYSRMGLSVFANRVFLLNRESFSNQSDEQDEQILAQASLQDLAQVIQLLKSGQREQVPPYAPPVIEVSITSPSFKDYRFSILK